MSAAKRYGWTPDLIAHLEKTGWPADKMMVEESTIGQFVMHEYPRAAPMVEQGETPETDALTFDIDRPNDAVLVLWNHARSLERRLRSQPAAATNQGERG